MSRVAINAKTNNQQNFRSDLSHLRGQARWTGGILPATSGSRILYGSGGTYNGGSEKSG